MPLFFPLFFLFRSVMFCSFFPRLSVRVNHRQSLAVTGQGRGVSLGRSAGLVARVRSTARRGWLACELGGAEGGGGAGEKKEEQKETGNPKQRKKKRGTPAGLSSVGRPVNQSIKGESIVPSTEVLEDLNNPPSPFPPPLLFFAPFTLVCPPGAGTGPCSVRTARAVHTDLICARPCFHPTHTHGYISNYLNQGEPESLGRGGRGGGGGGGGRRR